MHIAVLQFLPECTSSLGGPSSLQLNDLYQIRDTAKVIFLILLTGEPVNSHRDSRVRLLLKAKGG